MNTHGFSEKSKNLLRSSNQDIPQALRDLNTTPKSGGYRWIFVISGILGYIIIAIASGFLFSLIRLNKTANIPNTQLNTFHPESLLGHLPYKEAPESELVPISANGRIKMRLSAAKSFQQMVLAARSSGIILVPLSGFRSIKQQENVFFQLKAQHNQTTAERANISAPPRYSEHHTGYAVDIGDGSAPATNLNLTFENTKALKWLQENAGHFNFEMSFPKNNAQGVSYEPWHWRYVGDMDSLKTFYTARNLTVTTGGTKVKISH